MDYPHKKQSSNYSNLAYGLFEKLFSPQSTTQRLNTANPHSGDNSPLRQGRFAKLKYQKEAIKPFDSFTFNLF